MVKIGRWLLLGLFSIIAFKEINSFLESQTKKKEKDKLEEYINKVIKIIQTEHKSYWNDSLDYNEAYAFAKDSYEASKKYNVSHALLLALAAHETGFENMITDRNLKNFSWGYYAINENNHKWLEEMLRKQDTAVAVNNVRKHRLLLNPKIQHDYAAIFIRHWMDKKKIKNMDSAIYVLKNWNPNKEHNEKVKKKFYNFKKILEKE